MSMDTDERIATALERIADALEGPRTVRLSELVDIAQRGLDRVAASFRLDRSPDDSRLAMQDLAMELRAALDAKPCDDRTCTDRDHWVPLNPNRCDPGCTRPSLHDGDCTGPCAAAMPGHRCTRAEHADDRHQWAMTDEEYDRRREEAGVPRDVFDDVRAWADGWEAKQQESAMRAAVAMLRETVMRYTDVAPDPDPLDESDHRPRHDRDGDHLYRHGAEHWHWAEEGVGACEFECEGARLTDADERFGPLTFCDCPDAC